MHREELIKAVAKDTEYTNVSIAKVLESLLNTITKALKKKDEVTLTGFGKFKLHKRKARMGRNPKTGDPVKIPAKTVAKFVPGTKLLKAVK